jgi:hypothetical protein
MNMNRGYTITQLVGGMCVALILSSIAVVSYSKYVEKSREAVCITNQKALLNAVILYEDEQGAVPAVLGDLKRRHLEKGYARAMKDSGWFVKLAHVTLKMTMSNEAYAQFLTYDNLKNYGVARDNLRCPSGPNGGICYGINANVAGKSWVEIPENMVIIGDCDSAVFSNQNDLRMSHKSKTVAVGLTKNGALINVNENGDILVVQGSTTPTFADGGNSSDVDPVAASGDAQAMIDAIVDLGLPQGKEDNLTEILEGAINHLGNGDQTAALQSANDFAAKVEMDITNGVLTQAEGEPLRTMANALISDLGG